MKKLICLCFLAVAFTACQNKSAYTINGNIDGVSDEGQHVYLEKWNDSIMLKVDSAIISSSGEFKMKGMSGESYLHFISFLKDGKRVRSIVMTEPGEIYLTYDSFFSIVGTPTNDAYTEYNKKQEELSVTKKALSDEHVKARDNNTLTDSLFTQIRTKLSKVWGESASLEFDFVKNNMSNELGKHLFLANYENFNFDQQKEIIALADEDYKSKKQIKSMLDHFEAMEAVAIGKDYIDFTMEDPTGKTVSLSDYVGENKYVFIDFWASWCGPCIAEIPGIIDAYEKYKSKGLEIVGVSLDKDRDKWIKAIKEHEMTWPQMCDMKDWKSPVVKLYAIQGVPHTLLIDEYGKIVAHNLRGRMLDATLAKLLD